MGSLGVLSFIAFSLSIEFFAILNGLKKLFLLDLKLFDVVAFIPSLWLRQLPILIVKVITF